MVEDSPQPETVSLKKLIGDLQTAIGIRADIMYARNELARTHVKNELITAADKFLAEQQQVQNEKIRSLLRVFTTGHF